MTTETGGRAAVRGFVVQALIALLDSLQDEDWDHVGVEPAGTDEVVDLRWRRAGTTLRVVQVKSAQRPAKVAQIRDAARRLAGVDAVRREIVVCGRAPAAATSIAAGMGVGLRVEPGDVGILLDAAAFRLNTFAERAGVARRPASGRSSVLEVVGTLLARSIEGLEWTRSEFEQLLLSATCAPYADQPGAATPPSATGARDKSKVAGSQDPPFRPGAEFRFAVRSAVLRGSCEVSLSATDQVRDIVAAAATRIAPLARLGEGLDLGRVRLRIARRLRSIGGVLADDLPVAQVPHRAELHLEFRYTLEITDESAHGSKSGQRREESRRLIAAVLGPEAAVLDLPEGVWI